VGGGKTRQAFSGRRHLGFLVGEAARAMRESGGGLRWRNAFAGKEVKDTIYGGVGGDQVLRESVVRGMGGYKR